MSARFLAIDEPDAEALARRQRAAVRAALAWLRAHPVQDDGQELIAPKGRAFERKAGDDTAGDLE